jgi:hypothetical protein
MWLGEAEEVESRQVAREEDDEEEAAALAEGGEMAANRSSRSAT